MSSSSGTPVTPNTPNVAAPGINNSTFNLDKPSLAQHADADVSRLSPMSSAFPLQARSTTVV
jgi:hypothetical protein